MDIPFRILHEVYQNINDDIFTGPQKLIYYVHRHKNIRSDALLDYIATLEMPCKWLDKIGPVVAVVLLKNAVIFGNLTLLITLRNTIKSYFFGGLFISDFNKMAPWLMEQLMGHYNSHIHFDILLWIITIVNFNFIKPIDLNKCDDVMAVQLLHFSNININQIYNSIDIIQWHTMTQEFHKRSKNYRKKYRIRENITTPMAHWHFINRRAFFGNMTPDAKLYLNMHW
jgi:hypothetical protein